MNYKSIEDLNRDILQNIHMIPHDIDLIVGVPRSGLLVANIIALLLNLQLTDVDGLLSDRIISSGSTKRNYYNGGVEHVSECKKILVVEDTVYSGASLQSVKNRIKESQLSCEVLYFAAYVFPGKEALVDYYFQILPGPRVFEWNLFHSGAIENSCVDIDGVLCVDPTQEENDDGERYRFFLEHATPKIIPTRRIKYIVSSRLEKYREETENWLIKNKVSYDKLFLLDSTAEERRKNGLHAVFKSKVYKQSDCWLFIESEPWQAAHISKETQKLVYCIKDNRFYGGNGNPIEPIKKTPTKKRTIRSFMAKSPFLRKIYRWIKKVF